MQHYCKFSSKNQIIYKLGAIIGGIIVLLYCFSGGIRASIWTDVAQSIVLIIAMSLMVIFGIIELGGLSSFVNQLHKISPDYMKWFPSTNFSLHNRMKLMVRTKKYVIKHLTI